MILSFPGGTPRRGTWCLLGVDHEREQFVPHGLHEQSLRVNVALGDYDKIQRNGDSLLMQPEELAQQTLDAIASDRGPHFPAHGEAGAPYSFRKTGGQREK